jgi:hypothetical protein
MIDTQFKVGDMVRNETGVGFLEEFGIIYDIDIGSDPYDEPLVKIYWQTTQKTIIYYLSTVKDRVNTIQHWIHYPA